MSYLEAYIEASQLIEQIDLIVSEESTHPLDRLTAIDMLIAEYHADRA